MTCFVGQSRKSANLPFITQDPGQRMSGVQSRKTKYCSISTAGRQVDISLAEVDKSYLPRQLFGDRSSQSRLAREQM